MKTLSRVAIVCDNRVPPELHNTVWTVLATHRSKVGTKEEYENVWLNQPGTNYYLTIDISLIEMEN